MIRARRIAELLLAAGEALAPPAPRSPDLADFTAGDLAVEAEALAAEARRPFEILDAMWAGHEALAQRAIREHWPVDRFALEQTRDLATRFRARAAAEGWAAGETFAADLAARAAVGWH